MVKKITLTNFQSHKDSTLDLSPSVNVILGTSDSGKSAILRGLRWVVENKPLGDSFRSHWAGKHQTAVVIDVDEETIGRYKSNSVNKYDDGTTEYKALGQEVPEPIADLLNVVPEVNFQWQHDSAFLISRNSGDVARILNRSVQLDAIDTALSNINKVVLNTSREVAEAEGQLEATEKALEPLRGLEDLSGRVDATAGLSKRLTECQQISTLLSGSVDRLRTGYQNLRKLKIFLRQVDPSSAVEWERKLKACREVLSALGSLKKRHDRMEQELAEAGAVLAAGYRLGAAQKLADDIRPLRERQRKLAEKRVALASLLGTLKTTRGVLAAAEKDFKELMPDTCPLCGQEVAHG